MSSALTRHTYTEDGANFLYPFVRTDCIFFPNETEDNGIDKNLRGGSAIAKSLIGTSLVDLEGVSMQKSGSTFSVATVENPSDSMDSSVVLSSHVGRIDLMAQGNVSVSGDDVLIGASKLVLCDKDGGVYIVQNASTTDYTTVVKSKLMISSPDVTVTGGSKVTFTSAASLVFSPPSSLIMDSDSTAVFNNIPKFNNGMNVVSGDISLGASSGIQKTLSSYTTTYPIVFVNNGSKKLSIEWNSNALTSTFSGTVRIKEDGTTYPSNTLNTYSVKVMSASTSYVSMESSSANVGFNAKSDNKVAGLSAKNLNMQLFAKSVSNLPNIVTPHILMNYSGDTGCSGIVLTGSSSMRFAHYSGSTEDLGNIGVRLQSVNSTNRTTISTTNPRMDIQFGPASSCLSVNDSPLRSATKYLTDTATGSTTTYTFGSSNLPKETTHVFIYAEEKQGTNLETILKFPVNSLSEGQMVLVTLVGDSETAANETMRIKCQLPGSNNWYDKKGSSRTHEVFSAIIVGAKCAGWYTSTDTNIYPLMLSVWEQ